MTELSFTKSFLSLLDSRPIKLRPDHVFDPEQVGLRVPYTLPRLPPTHPSMPPKTRQRIIPGTSKSITIHLKSARNPVLELTVPNAPVSTTNVEDLKDAVRNRVVDGQGNMLALEKIKVLYKRKPVSGNNTKTVAEILGDEPDMLSGGKEVEFGVMIIGGVGVRVVEPEDQAETEVEKVKEAKEEQEQEKQKEAVSVSVAAEEVLRAEAFWDDLQGFLAQRLKDDNEAKKMRALFESAWARR